jgi:hypothetical protein
MTVRAPRGKPPVDKQQPADKALGPGPWSDPLACADELAALAALSPVDAGNMPAVDRGLLIVLDLEAGKELLRAPNNQSLTAVAWRPRGSLLAVAALDGSVRLVSPEGVDGPVLPRGSPALCLAFDPDGGRLAAGYADGEARVWGVGDGESLFALRDHGGAVTALAFSPDGARLVTASADRAVRVWESATGRRLLTLRGHDHPPVGAAFAADGRVLLTADEGGRLLFWGAHDPAGLWRPGRVFPGVGTRPGEATGPDADKDKAPIKDRSKSDAEAPGPPDRKEEKKEEKK